MICMDDTPGYLGAFLLRRLLDVSPECTVHCHVRASDVAKGFQRLRDALEKHQLWLVGGWVERRNALLACSAWRSLPARL